MKIQATKSFLAIALLGIWGLVGYQLYQKLGPQDDFLPVHHSFDQQGKVERAEPFKLLVNYRDPFLEERLKKQAPVRSAPATINVAPRQKIAPAKPIAFPKIIYKGTIKLKNDREVALVNIDGKTVHLAVKENHQKVELLRIYEDSIRLNFQGTDKVIPKFKAGR